MKKLLLTILLCGLFSFFLNSQTSTSEQFILYNDNTIQASNIAMESDRNGVYVCVWEGTDISDNHEIYYRIYNSFFNPLTDIICLTNSYAGDHSEPDVDMDLQGNFVVSWTSDGLETNGTKGIYALRLNLNTGIIGDLIHVNSIEDNDQIVSDIAINKNTGEFAILFKSYQSTGSGDGLYIQRFTTEGIKSGSTFFLGDDSSGSICINSTNNHIGIAILDNHSRIEYEQYDINNNLVEWEIITPYYFGSWVTPVIATDSVRTVIVYHNSDDNFVHAVSIIPEYPKFTKSFEVAEVDYSPILGVCVGGDGEFAVSYVRMNSNNRYDLYLKKYNYNCLLETDEIIINTQDDYEHSNPQMCYSDNHNLAIAWEALITNPDSYILYGKEYSYEDFPISNEYLNIANEKGGECKTAMDETGNYIITWMHDRQYQSPGHGYMKFNYRMYSTIGHPLSDFHSINNLNDYKRFNLLTMNSSGYFALCWSEENTYNEQVYYQVFSPDGQGFTPIIKVSDGYSFEKPTSIGIDESSNISIIWHDSNDNFHESNFDFDGNQTGTHIPTDHTMMMMNDAGNKYYYHTSSQQVHTLQFFESGNTVGETPIVLDNAGSSSGHYYIRFEMNEANNFAAIWRKSDIGYVQFYGKYYNYLTDDLISLGMINEDNDNDRENYDVALDENGYSAFVWDEEAIPGNRSDIFLQVFDPQGLKIFDVPLLLNTYTGLNSIFPDVSMLNGKILIVWNADQDLTTSNYDYEGLVSSRILYLDEFLNPNSINEALISSDPDNNLFISPNPCTDILNVDFNNKNNRNIFIKIYDIQGQLILHSILDKNGTINTSRLKDGAYFIRAYNNGSYVGSNRFIKINSY